MTLLKTAVLAAVYGLTQFFPVSSQAHLALLQKILKFHQALPAFYPAVKVGMLAALAAHFARPIAQMARETFLVLVRFPSDTRRAFLFDEFPHARMAVFILLASVPAAGIRLVFKENLETVFGWLLVMGAAWIVMGILLLAGMKCRKGERTFYELNHEDAFVVGLGQGMAILPGLSRSGLAILAGMSCGLQPREAAQFSFLLSIPLLLGSIFLEVKAGVAGFFEADPRILGIGFLVSAVASYLAIAGVLKLAERRLFFLFGFYCLAMGFAALIMSFLPR